MSDEEYVPPSDWNTSSSTHDADLFEPLPSSKRKKTKGKITLKRGGKKAQLASLRIPSKPPTKPETDAERTYKEEIPRIFAAINFIKESVAEMKAAEERERIALEQKQKSEKKQDNNSSVFMLLTEDRTANDGVDAILSKASKRRAAGISSMTSKRRTSVVSTPRSSSFAMADGSSAIAKTPSKSSVSSVESVAALWQSLKRKREAPLKIGGASMSGKRKRRRLAAVVPVKNVSSVGGGLNEGLSNAPRASQASADSRSATDAITAAEEAAAYLQSAKPEMAAVSEDKSKPNLVGLFVTGLSHEVDDCRLRAMFEHCGGLHSTRVDSQRRGFGFVNFYSLEQGTTGIEDMDGRVIAGQKITVRWAKRKKQADKSKPY